METIRGCLIDLGGAASSVLSDMLRAAFEEGGVSARLDRLEGAPGEGASIGCRVADRLRAMSANILFLVVPPDFGEAERALIRILGTDAAGVPVIAVVDGVDPYKLLDLLRLGVVDFITPPLRSIDILPRALRLVEHLERKATLHERLKEKTGLRQIIGTGAALTAEVAKIPLIARCDSSVLISGETGTGKEMFARAVHYLSPRAGKPFVPVNCGAIPAGLVENELFGHARGAFTNAATSEQGLVQEADRGTLFLDEIDCLPLAAQVKLLRFLQEKQYRKLGSPKMKQADVRVIAAANADLEQAVRQGELRRDLYYRLNVIPLRLPPLRERREDIPLLALHFIGQYSREFGKAVDGIAPEAERKLVLYDWPGNVRELQNVIERAVVFSSGRVLLGDDFDLGRTEGAPAPASFRRAKADVIVTFEKSYIRGLLAAHRGNITQAARTAGKNRRALFQLLKKHGIDAEQFRTGQPKT